MAAAEGSQEQGKEQPAQGEAAAGIWRQAGGKGMPQLPREAAAAAQGEERS